MIYSSTTLKISDNSGGKFLKCIKIFKKGSFTKVGFVGDVIIGSVQQLRTKNRYLSKVKKGDVVYGVIIRTKSTITRKIGVSLNFYTNDVVLLSRTFKPIASRVFGVLPKELRQSKFAKIISLSNGVT